MWRMATLDQFDYFSLLRPLRNAANLPKSIIFIVNALHC